MRGGYPDPGHDVEKFLAGATVAVKFQLPSLNFKRTKAITDATKAYSSQAPYHSFHLGDQPSLLFPFSRPESFTSLG